MLDSTVLWLAFAWVLILEGLMPLLMPKAWQQWLSQLSTQSSANLRRLGGCFVVAGVVIAVMVVRHLP